MTQIFKSPEPFRLEGSGRLADTELLMIHGFTGSPSEFRRLGYYLNDLGYTVNAVLLPGHGTTPEDMIRTRWTDWLEHVRQCYDRMAERPDKRIVCIGHSMGGLLALKLAMERPVEGVVSLATPIYLTSRKPALAVLLQHFIKYVDKKRIAARHIIEEACTYDKAPVPCVVDLRRLLKSVKTSLKQVRVPVFVAQGEKDGVVHPRSAEFIYHHIASPVRQISMYGETSHAMLLDREKERVYADIHGFLQNLDSFGAWKQAAACLSP